MCWRWLIGLCLLTWSLLLVVPLSQYALNWPWVYLSLSQWYVASQDFKSFWCVFLLTKPETVELPVFTCVGGNSWSIDSIMHLIVTSIWAFRKSAPISDSATDTNECRRVLHTIRMAPFNVGWDARVGCCDNWKYPALLLFDFSGLNKKHHYRLTVLKQWCDAADVCLDNFLCDMLIISIVIWCI